MIVYQKWRLHLVLSIIPYYPKRTVRCKCVFTPYLIFLVLSMKVNKKTFVTMNESNKSILNLSEKWNSNLLLKNLKAMVVLSEKKSLYED